MKVVTCPTEGCRNQGVEVLWNYDQIAADILAEQPDAELEDSIGPFFCGVCGTDITDTARDVADDYVPVVPVIDE